MLKLSLICYNGVDTLLKMVLRVSHLVARFQALERWEKVEGVAHVIDAKAMSKDALYGVMDPNTREWTDGLFTAIIRR